MSDTSIIRPSPTAGAPASAPLATAVTITDYVLIRMIGGGAFGEVWLAQSRATGRYRAVKIVYKERVPTAHSYETEFAGLKRFEEISRESLGFVDILHISRHDEAGYFYYVMELADDLEAVLELKSGILAGDVRDSPSEQELGGLSLRDKGTWKESSRTFGSLDTIACSEIFRDIAMMED